MRALFPVPYNISNVLLVGSSNSRFRLKPFDHISLQTSKIRLRMQTGGNEGSKNPNSHPKVAKLQENIHDESAGNRGKFFVQAFSDIDGWDKCWAQGLTPWDLGKPTPIIIHLLQTGALPKGRILVPGCGSGYDVVTIASPERHVVGLDVSEIAIQKARELSSSLPNAHCFTFLKADFFTWLPSELFDVIFDYTFFCALEPFMRAAWARRARDLLKPSGELITLMFPVSDHVGGPPYKVSVADYEEVLHPLGFEAISIVDNELAVGPRKGREKLGRWKRSMKRSLL